MLRPRERWSLRPLFPPQEGVSDPFSHRKRENLVHPPNPLAQIPLAQRIREEPGAVYRSRFSGRGCDEALFSEKEGIFSEKGGGNSSE